MVNAAEMRTGGTRPARGITGSLGWRRRCSACSSPRAADSTRRPTRRRPAPVMSWRIWRRCGLRRQWWRPEASRRRRRRKPHSVWELLPQVEPALTEWAAYFAAGAGKRAAAEAGPAPRGIRARGRRPAAGCGDLPVTRGDRARRRGAVSAPAEAGGLAAQNPSIAPRASASSTPQLMSSSVRSAGDLS